MFWETCDCASREFHLHLHAAHGRPPMNSQATPPHPSGSTHITLNRTLQQAVLISLQIQRSTAFSGSRFFDLRVPAPCTLLEPRDSGSAFWLWMRLDFCEIGSRLSRRGRCTPATASESANTNTELWGLSSRRLSIPDLCVILPRPLTTTTDTRASTSGLWSGYDDALER